MAGGATQHRITTQGSKRTPRPDSPRCTPAMALKTAGLGANITAPCPHKTGQTKPQTPRKGRGPRPPLPLWLFMVALVGMQWRPTQAAATVPTEHTVGSKRAIRRAARRAMAQGSTWYKGKWITAKQLSHINTASAQRTHSGSDRRGPRGGTKYSDRISLLSLNVGSLSTLLWQELKEYLLKAPYDVICLQETHWSTSSEFVVQGWRAIHSGTKARADGVLTLIHPRHRADTIRHEEIQSGRILRTQLQTPQGRVELFNCYQFPHNFTVNPTVLRDKRQALLSKLGRAIAGIPLRATLVIVGDFQAEVKPAVPHVGRSTCNTPFHTGAGALDPDALNTFLESYGLTALNTWCGPPQPTQFNQAPNNKTGTSQIDFIITRLTTADAQAKRVRVSKPPIGTWRLHIGHFGLEANLRVMNHFLLPARKAAALPIDKTGLDEAARCQNKKALQLREAVIERVEQSAESSPGQNIDINQVLLQACPQTFPAVEKPPTKHNEVIQHLWRLRQQARYTAVQAKRTGRLFAAWRAAIRYHLEAKKAKKACQVKQRQEILDRTRAEVRGTTVYASDTLPLGDIEGISASQHRRCSGKHCKCFR